MHELYAYVGRVGGSPKLLGLDVWTDLDGALEHYGDATHGGYKSAFAGAVQASIWEQAPGAWSEW